MNIAGQIFEDVDEILARDEHELARRYLIQSVYKAYVSFRTIVGGQKCKKMRLAELKYKLEDPANVVKIINTLPHYNEESIAKILEIAENNIPIIK